MGLRGVLFLLLLGFSPAGFANDLPELSKSAAQLRDFLSRNPLPPIPADRPELQVVFELDLHTCTDCKKAKEAIYFEVQATNAPDSQKGPEWVGAEGFDFEPVAKRVTKSEFGLDDRQMTDFVGSLIYLAAARKLDPTVLQSLIDQGQSDIARYQLEQILLILQSAPEVWRKAAGAHQRHLEGSGEAPDHAVFLARVLTDGMPKRGDGEMAAWVTKRLKRIVPHVEGFAFLLKAVAAEHVKAIETRFASEQHRPDLTLARRMLADRGLADEKAVMTEYFPWRDREMLRHLQQEIVESATAEKPPTTIKVITGAAHAAPFAIVLHEALEAAKADKVKVAIETEGFAGHPSHARFDASDFEEFGGLNMLIVYTQMIDSWLHPESPQEPAAPSSDPVPPTPNP